MLKQSPGQTIGPFFHFGLIYGGENRLVNENTRGERIRITGQVLDGEGQPVLDAMVEIWQADAQGYFNHAADPNAANADPHFRGFGRADTANDGTYWFETVKPGRVVAPDGTRQAPHVNVRVFARGMMMHADTRLYFADETANAGDTMLQAIDPTRRHTLLATRGSDAPDSTYRFDIRLQGADETVFFQL